MKNIPYVAHGCNNEPRLLELDDYKKLTLKYDFYNWLPRTLTDYSEVSLANDFSLCTGYRVSRRRIMNMKDELWEDGDIEIVLLPNGRRSNPKHKIVKMSGDEIRALDLMMRHRQLHRLAEWNDLSTAELIDCYFRSHWNIIPCSKKRPIFNRGDWQRKTRSEKKQYLLTGKYQIGLWISGFNEYVFDFDCETDQRFDTLTAKSPHGFHFYFQPRAGIHNTVKKVSPVIDTRAKGGLIIIPPTPNYHWLNLTNPTPLPNELWAMWKERNRDAWNDCYASPMSRRTIKLDLQLRDAKGRNDYLFRLGRSLRSSRMQFQEIESRLRRFNESLPVALPERELSYLIRHVWTYQDSADYVKNLDAAKINRGMCSLSARHIHTSCS